MFYRAQVWLAEHKQVVILGVLIFLVSSLSFVLGYLTAQQTGQAPIIIQKIAP